MLQAITALPTVAIGPRRPFVLEVRPEGLKVRAATVADTGLGGLPAGRLVQQALEDLCDGQRTSLLITQALIRGLQDARVRVHAPESRLAFSFALRRLTPEWLCEAEDVLTTQQQRESGSNTALFGAWLRCMLRCELGGASFEAACRIVSGGMPYGPSRKSCLVAVTLDRPISDSRVCVGAMAVFNHRPQPRFPLLPSDGAVRTVVCAEFPIEVVAHDPRKETSSDDDDEDSSRASSASSGANQLDPALTPQQRNLYANTFTRLLVEYAQAVGLDTILTPQELVEEVILGAYPALRIIDGVDEQAFQAMAATDVNLSLLAVGPAGWFTQPPSPLPRARVVSETKDAISVYPDAGKSSARSANLALCALVCGPAVAVTKEITRCVQKGVRCVNRYYSESSTFLSSTPRWQHLALISRGLRRDDGVVAAAGPEELVARRWLSDGLMAAGVELLRQVEGSSYRAAANKLGGRYGEASGETTTDPADAVVDHPGVVIDALATSLETVGALLRLDEV
jgi:hypothetical protein